jgi:2,3,4,5-tetrahydropyridine-2-carboxylate N-succinyltransferase
MSADHPTGDALLDALEAGEVRVAQRTEDGRWIVNAWIKEEILRIFKSSPLVAFGNANTRGLWPFVDKELLPPRHFGVADGVRLVPGGSAVRRGARLERGVICMPPMYVNIGAYVGTGSLIDSHALVGSCAQIGERVHLSAAAQIGGVLEPMGARPVIVEDDAFIGGNCGLYDGVLVRRRAVLAAGVVLTASTVVYDTVRHIELRGTRDEPLEIPEDAVVVPGSRPVTQHGPLDLWATHRHLHVACALIVKYRDARTDRATALEDALR